MLARVSLVTLLLAALLPGSAVATEGEQAIETADAWLRRIEQRFADIRTLQARIVLHRIEAVGILDDRETRLGSLFYTAGPPALFAIHFVQRSIDGRPEPQSMWYRFDGRWLVERDDQEKLFTRTEVVAPDAPAHKTDPLTTGDGPFFLPITAKREHLLKRFTVDLVAAGPRDPADTVHLRLRPRPDRRMAMTRIDLWYHRKSLLPVRVETLDDAPNQSIVTVRQITLDRPVDPAVVDTSVPRERGWRVTVRPYEKPEQGAGGG